MYKRQAQQEAQELERKLKWMQETEMAVVISQEQNEIQTFKKWNLDIKYHRTKMEKRELDKEFKDSKNPLRVVFEMCIRDRDGNGRVGRLIMFKECLKYNIVPFIIDDNLKLFYYRGLKEWSNEKGYLTDTCLTAQDKYKAYLDYFRIEYDK